MRNNQHVLCAPRILLVLLILFFTGCSALPMESRGKDPSNQKEVKSSSLVKAADPGRKVDQAKGFQLSHSLVTSHLHPLGKPTGSPKPVLVSSSGTSPWPSQPKFSHENSGGPPGVSDVHEEVFPHRPVAESQKHGFGLWGAQDSGRALDLLAQASPEMKLEGKPEGHSQDQAENDMAKLADKMNNPVGDLWLLWTQNDTMLINGDLLAESRVLNVTSFQPVIPIPINKDWNLVNRLIIQLPMIPIDRNVGGIFSHSPDGGEITTDPTLASALDDPFASTTFGFGDLVYLGMISPEQEFDFGFIWAVGPSIIFPTASHDLLGQGKWQAGPAALAAYLGKKWNLGVLPMQWWSFAGKDKRADTSQLNLQYFWQYKLGGKALWQVGAAPNIRVNWEAGSGNKYSVPIGFGANRMVRFGKIPARVGFEAHWFAVRPDNLGPMWNFRVVVIPVIPNLVKFWDDL